MTDPVAPFKKRAPKSNSRKRAVTPPSESDSGFTSSEDGEGRQIKRRRKTVGVSATSANTHTARAPEPSLVSDNIAQPRMNNADNATKASNWYDEEHDKAHGGKPDVRSEPENPLDGTYKGTANYSTFLQKNPDKASKTVGPQKTSSNVRTITVTDFAPDVCKDYKKTGWCGFGDSCKYLHSREAYKQGWEIDREWEVTSKGKKMAGRVVASANRDAGVTERDEDDDKLLESIPFACIICQQPYTNPIVTKCTHYFCEACALKRYRKDPSCAACGASTGGVFNVAKKLNKLLERKRERAKQKREEAIENGVDPTEEASELAQT